MKKKLFILAIIFLGLFTDYSYTVARERWQQHDFDTTVKLQDHISRKYDLPFSYFSLLGSAEVTIGLCLILAVLSLLKGRFLAIIGWLMIVPASLGEVFGKLVLFHPSPPVFMHRSLLPTNLPSFYVHTDFSYPSGHMTRTVFIITVFLAMILFTGKKSLFKSLVFLGLSGLIFLMGLTRIYLGEHWTTDVIGGALLGAGMGFLASVLILRPQKHNIAPDARGR